VWVICVYLCEIKHSQLTLKAQKFEQSQKMRIHPSKLQIHFTIYLDKYAAPVF